MDRIPILRMGQFLLVTIQVDMHDRLALALQDDLTSRIVKDRAKGVPAEHVNSLRRAGPGSFCAWGDGGSVHGTPHPQTNPTVEL